MPAKEQIEIGIYINYPQQTKLQNRLPLLGFLLAMEVAILKELKK